MSKHWIGWGLAVLVGVMCCGDTALAGEAEDAARAILEKNKSAVVTVRIVVKVQMSFMGTDGGEAEESKSEATGTVIMPDGLTVLALSAMDPATLIANMLGGMMDDNMKIDNEVSDVKILSDTGGEIPATVVLRDKDLDLGFVRPVEKLAQPMAFLDLSQGGAAQILDQLVVLNRLGKVANRVYAVSFERIEAVVEKPRRFYVPSQSPTHAAPGCPAFGLDGKALGILVIRSIKDTDGGGGIFGEMMGTMQNMVPIILPAAEVFEVAKQAPERGAAPVETPAEPSENRTEVEVVIPTEER